MKGKVRNLRREGLGLLVTSFFLEKSFKLMWQQTVDILLHLVEDTELPFILLSLIIQTFFSICLKCFII